MQVRAFAALEQELRPVAARFALHGCADRSQDSNALDSRPLGQPARRIEKPVRVGSGGRSGTDKCQPGKGWPQCAFALGKGAFSDTLVAAAEEFVPERMGGKCGLHDDFALLSLATRPAGNLDKTLRQALPAPEVGTEKALIGIDDDHQRQVWKVMTFRQHLGADENPCVPGSRHCQCATHCSFQPGAVRVDTRNFLAWKSAAQCVLEPLRTMTERPTDGPAVGTLAFD